jgi:hypothetical protein
MMLVIAYVTGERVLSQGNLSSSTARKTRKGAFPAFSPRIEIALA